MIIKTKEFLEAANKILLAAGLDQNAANLELVAKESSLYLNVTNKEFFVSVRFPLETEETFRVVVDASLFLSLVASAQPANVYPSWEGFGIVNGVSFCVSVIL